jgi:energy-converting hydrogenase Eha subunit G
MIKMGFLKTLVKFIGEGCIIFGLIFTGFGIYGLAGGTGIRFHIGGELATPQEGGQVTSILGISLLIIGIVITYIHRKKMM